VPLPSPPYSLWPQHSTVPPDRSAQAEPPLPTEIAVLVAKDWTLTLTVPGTDTGGEIAFWPQDTWNGDFYECSGGGANGAGGTCCPPDGQPSGEEACLPNGTLPSGLTTTSGAPMATGAGIFQAGGEVANPITPDTPDPNPFSLNSPPAIEMGSGIGAPLGYENAAYHRNIEFYLGDTSGSYIIYNQTTSDRYIGFSSPFSNSSANPIYATDMNCYNYGFGYGGVPASVSLTEASLGYTFLQDDPGHPSSYTSAEPGVAGNGANGWGAYLYYGGIGTVSNAVFAALQPTPNQGFDFCCTTHAQNGAGVDSQCAASQ